MSKLTGGLFSRPSGKNSGLVFSSARTSRGKRATARNYVIPTQPGTSAQLLTKQKMAGVAEIYRQLPEQIRRYDLKKLPGAVSGYVALSKLFMPILDYPPAIRLQRTIVSLGGLHFPRSINVYRNTSAIEFTPRWSTELNDSGSASDTLNFFYIRWSSVVQSPEDFLVAGGVDVAVRSDGAANLELPGFSSAVGLGFIYFRSAVNGELSPALLQQPSSAPP